MFGWLLIIQRNRVRPHGRTKGGKVNGPFCKPPKKSIPATNMEPNEPAAQTREKKPRTLTFYIFLASVLYVVIHAYALLSPILLSFILIILITLAVNPIISRMRSWTGGRKRATGLVLLGVVTF